MACDMPEPCKFPSLDSCQRRFLWTQEEVDLAPHAVVGLVLQVGDAKKFPLHLVSKTRILFFGVSKQGPCFTATEEDGGDKSLVQLELACETEGVGPPDSVSSAHSAIAGAILMRISAKQVPSLHRVAPKCRKLVTSPNYWPFMLISALVSVVLLVMTLLFSVLTSIHMPLLCLRFCWSGLEVHHAAARKIGVVGES